MKTLIKTLTASFDIQEARKTYRLEQPPSGENLITDSAKPSPGFLFLESGPDTPELQKTSVAGASLIRQLAQNATNFHKT